MKIAIPVVDGTYSSPLEEAKEFAIITVENGNIKGQENTFPDPNEVGSLNKWLHKIGVELVLVGCMEPRKSMNIKNNGINVIFCSACLTPNEMVKLYLKGII
jgi:predicted Fe-Mo cluster-binding NifX family protein